MNILHIAHLLSIYSLGIAKGYCVDWIVSRLNVVGYSDVYVDWGSDIKATGQVSYLLLYISLST